MQRLVFEIQSVNPHHQFAKSRPGLAPGHDTKHINKNLPFLKKADKHHEKTWKNNRKTRKFIQSKDCLSKLLLKIFLAICMQAQALSESGMIFTRASVSPMGWPKKVGRFPSEASPTFPGKYCRTMTCINSGRQTWKEKNEGWFTLRPDFF